MHKPSPDRVHLTTAEARELAERVATAMGYTVVEARIIADHIIDAALCGYEYSGLPKLLSAAEHPRAGLPRTPMRAVRETAISTLFDAGNNIGMLAMSQAARVAIERANAHGFSLVGVTNSWMSGRSAYYVEMIARADLVAIHTVSSSRNQVAPQGAARPALGTNPLAFGLPSLDNPLIFDMGTSALTFTDMVLRERRGELLPEGVAIDAEGRPTRDPARARGGALLSFGAYKGFGLALMMQAFGLLAGSHRGLDPDYGYLLIAFKPDLLTPLDEFKQQLAQLVVRIKATPRQPGVEEIRIPSERAYRERERSLCEGIMIDAAVYEGLLKRCS